MGEGRGDGSELESKKEMKLQTEDRTGDTQTTVSRQVLTVIDVYVPVYLLKSTTLNVVDPKGPDDCKTTHNNLLVPVSNSRPTVTGKGSVSLGGVSPGPPIGRRDTSTTSLERRLEGTKDLNRSLLCSLEERGTHSKVDSLGWEGSRLVYGDFKPSVVDMLERERKKKRRGLCS